VHIPAGQKILLDVDPPKLYLVLIEGTLKFKEMDLSFDAHYIMVRNGNLIIGTESQPIMNNKIIVTLHGRRDDKHLPAVGNKVLSIYGGWLNIHGKPRNISWTTLSVTAFKGENTIQLTDSVDWQANEQIVVASSGFNHKHAEVMTIETVINDKKFRLKENFNYPHYSVKEY